MDMLLLCPIPAKQVAGAGVPGSSQKARQCPRSTLLTPDTSTAARWGGVAEGYSITHPSQTKLPSHPSQGPQSHQPMSPGLAAKGCHDARSVLSLQLSRSYQKATVGDQSSAPGTAVLRGEKTLGRAQRGPARKHIAPLCCCSCSKTVFGNEHHKEFSYGSSSTFVPRGTSPGFTRCAQYLAAYLLVVSRRKASARSPLPFTPILLHDATAFWGQRFPASSFARAGFQAAGCCPAWRCQRSASHRGCQLALFPCVNGCSALLTSGPEWRAVCLKKKTTPKLELVSWLLCLQEFRRSERWK